MCIFKSIKGIFIKSRCHRHHHFEDENFHKESLYPPDNLNLRFKHIFFQIRIDWIKKYHKLSINQTWTIRNVIKIFKIYKVKKKKFFLKKIQITASLRLPQSRQKTSKDVRSRQKTSKDGSRRQRTSQDALRPLLMSQDAKRCLKTFYVL